LIERITPEVEAMLRIITLLLLAMPVLAESKGFLSRKYKNADGTESPYVVFVPHHFDGTTALPAILFLHGSGETKGGKKMPAEVGLGAYIKENEKTFAFLTVIPQSEKRTWFAESDDAKRALAIFDAVQKEFKVDPNRQYLTGLSMGGFGTWSIAAAHPDRFAAIVPICGGVQPRTADDVAKKLKNIPCWCFHGDADTAVKVDKSREMIEALKKAGGSPKYTEYPGVAHNSWDKAYATADLWKWLAEQKKP
jgi:predicted peptidase